MMDKKDTQIEAMLKESEVKIAEKVKSEYEAQLEVVNAELQCKLNANFRHLSMDSLRLRAK